MGPQIVRLVRGEGASRLPLPLIAVSGKSEAKVTTCYLTTSEAVQGCSPCELRGRPLMEEAPLSEAQSCPFTGLCFESLPSHRGLRGTMPMAWK